MTCENWLMNYLSQKIIANCVTVRSKAHEQGFSIFKLRAARKALGVKTLLHYDKETGATTYYWYLEKEDDME